jgi:RHS repeat-associated protein
MLDVTDGTSGAPTVASASYGIAGQLTGMSYFGWSESREFNNLFQMTHQWVSNGSSNVMDMRYNYTAGANNGRITSSVDGIIGETVNYSYDSLNRLSSALATNNAWGQGFGYDGFGNLTSKTALAGSVPTMSVSFDPLTNHQNGVGYDANGNPNGASYDVENRMISGNGETYSYDHAGKRVLKQYTIAAPSPNAGSPGFEVYFYGIGGQKLMTKQCWVDQNGFPHCPGGNGGNSGDYFNTYFGGKLVKSKNTVVVATDRLGSVRANSSGDQLGYYPYGEERTSTADGREKFGTYMRDNPGQDYADQRYYGVGTGRFNVPDPYKASGGSQDPPSWNRYAYVGGDPINFADPNGLSKIEVGPVCAVNGLPCAVLPPCDGLVETPGIACSGNQPPCGIGLGLVPLPGYVCFQVRVIPAPPKKVVPPLQCRFLGPMFSPVNGEPIDSSNGPGWYAISQFGFAATGGDGEGSYNWLESQYYTISATMNSPGVPPSYSRSGNDDPLQTLRAAGSSIMVYADGPGVPVTWENGATVTNATFTGTFTLSVTVSSGTQVASCGGIIPWYANINVTNSVGSGSGALGLIAH